MVMLFVFLLNREDNQLFLAYLYYQLQVSNSMAKKENMTDCKSRLQSLFTGSNVSSTNYKITVWSRASIFLSVPEIHHPKSWDNNYGHLIEFWWTLLVVKITFRYSVFSNEFDAIIWYRNLQNPTFSSDTMFWTSTLN